MDGIELARQLLPPRYLEPRRRAVYEAAEELRMRPGQALTMVVRGREYPIPGEAISEEELRRTLEKATGASLHTAAQALSRGFISYRGLRIGVCGTAVLRNGELSGFRSFSSLALRIPRAVPGVCDGVYREMKAGGLANTLIVSPPGGGKTTALRELIGCFSRDGLRVGVVDERFEIAAAELGPAQFALGAHCDVLSGVPKAEGAMMLLRGMNPQVLAMDEITQREDLAAIRETAGCGVLLLATAHAAGPEELRRRELYRQLLDEGIFSYCLKIRCTERGRSYSLGRLAV